MPAAARKRPAALIALYLLLACLSLARGQRAAAQAVAPADTAPSAGAAPSTEEAPRTEAAPPAAPPPPSSGTSEPSATASTPAAEGTAASSEPAAQPSATSSPGEQIFEDPELEGVAPSTPSASTPPPAAPSDAQARAVLHTRVGRDFRENDPREEVWESTTLGTLDATLRRSETLKFSLGLRLRYHFAALADDVSDAAAERQEFDAVPTTGYADFEPTSGVHVQLGYQGVQLGRFDIFSATNVLAVNDMRDGPATLPEAGDPVGQLAAMLDYDITSGISLRFIYVPFFTPHLVSLTESDYALFPATQQSTEAALAAAAGTNTPGAARRLTALVRENLSRDDRALIASSGFSALAPEPTLSHPQAALRVTAHGPAGEIALTAATALEHLPSLVLSQSFVDYLYDSQSFGNQAALAANPRPLSVRYGRFFVLAADGAMDVGPFSLGAEVAFMKDRALYAMRDAASVEGTPSPGAADMAQAGAPGGTPSPGAADMVQVGLRGEWISSVEWVAAIEAFGAAALEKPRDGVCKRPRDAAVNGECTWMFLDNGRLLTGVAALVSFAPLETGWHLEVGAGLLTGPSLAFMPRVAYEVIDNLEVELGALVIEGERVPTSGAPDAALGGIFDNVDQAFVGLRYQP